MNRERAGELWAIMRAYAEGKTIQHKVDGGWFDLPDPHFVASDVKSYRVKPENTYRPFFDSAELILEWNKKLGDIAALGRPMEPCPLQEPIIWVKHKVDDRRRLIVGFGEDFVEIGNKSKPVTMQRLFEMYTFLDGTPCGVRE